MNMRIIKEISDFIFIEDSLTCADAILIPGGSFPELPERAAELWHEGYAPLIVPSGMYSVKLGRFAGVKSKADRYRGTYITECDFYSDVLLQNGVKSDAIICEDRSGCTAENARFTRRMLDERGISLQKAIICCKGFHARRCLMFYQFSFPETEFMIAPVLNTPGMEITKDNWYLSAYGRKRVLGELERLGTQFSSSFEVLGDL